MSLCWMIDVTLSCLVGFCCCCLIFVGSQRWRLGLSGFEDYASSSVPTTHFLLLVFRTLLSTPSIGLLLPEQPPLLDFESLQESLPVLARLLEQSSLFAMFQIHTSSSILARHMRHINRNKNISLLIHKPNKRKQNRHEIRLVSATLLFGAWWRGC